jgi:hypothetical protein
MNSVIKVEDLQAAHRLSFQNETSVKASINCGCFHCLQIYPSSFVTTSNFISDTNGFLTAICPHCGLDSVIGDSKGLVITVDFLRLMNSHYFDGIQ